jgi:hypothetical protein
LDFFRILWGALSPTGFTPVERMIVNYLLIRAYHAATGFMPVERRIAR